ADIVAAVRALVAEGIAPEAIYEHRISAQLSTRGLPDPDLIVRTSGEWRLSNFLIWQAAYSEYWVTPAYWPDFTPDLLRQAIQDYGQRERRFGGLSEEKQLAGAARRERGCAAADRGRRGLVERLVGRRVRRTCDAHWL